MRQENYPGINSEMYSILGRSRGIVLFEAFLFLILGLWAISMPLFFAVVYDIAIGAILATGGLIQLFRTGKVWGTKGAWSSLFFSILSLAVGAVLLVKPIQGVIALTTLMAIFFMLEGIVKFSWAFSFETSQKWWILFSGAISILLSCLIFAGLPFNAVWVLGLFLGIDLLFYSVILFTFYFFLKKRQIG